MKSLKDVLGHSQILGTWWEAAERKKENTEWSISFIMVSNQRAVTKHQVVRQVEVASAIFVRFTLGSSVIELHFSFTSGRVGWIVCLVRVTKKRSFSLIP